MVADIARDQPGSNPGSLTVAGDHLFFTATTPDYGTELWSLIIPKPQLGTPAVTSVSAASAVVNASVNANGLATTVQVEYGVTAAYGNIVPVTLSSTDGTMPLPFSATLTGLAPATTYHLRLVATNAEGTAVSTDEVFTTITTAYEAWRFLHFGNADGDGPAANDADPDGDGQSNRLEYLAGTGPDDFESTLHFDAVPAPAALGTLRISPVRPGVRYIVQASIDGLKSWTDWPAMLFVAPCDSSTLADGAAPASRRFYRLRLEEAP